MEKKESACYFTVSVFEVLILSSLRCCDSPVDVRWKRSQSTQFGGWNDVLMRLKSCSSSGDAFIRKIDGKVGLGRDSSVYKCERGPPEYLVQFSQVLNHINTRHIMVRAISGPYLLEMGHSTVSRPSQKRTINRLGEGRWISYKSLSRLIP